MRRLLGRLATVDPAFDETEFVALHAHGVLTNQQKLLFVPHRYHHHRTGSLAHEPLEARLGAGGKTKVHLLNRKQPAGGDWCRVQNFGQGTHDCGDHPERKVGAD